MYPEPHYLSFAWSPADTLYGTNQHTVELSVAPDSDVQGQFVNNC
jgi:hypothetical protein